MNTWMIRMLGGAACTVGVLTAGATLAQADTSHHGLDVKAVVKVGVSHHDTKSPVKVKVAGRAHVANNNNNGNSSGSSDNAARSAPRRSSPAATAPQRSGVDVRAGVRVGTGNRSTSNRATSKRPTSSTPNKPAVNRKPLVHVTLEAVPLAKADVKIDTNWPSRAKQTDRSNSPSKRLVAANLDAEVKALGLPVEACIRLNTGDCTPGSGSDSGTGTGSGGGSTTPTNPILPVSLTNDTAASVTNLVDGAVCLRINADGCSANTGPGTTGGGLIPSVVSGTDAEVLNTPVNACILINADGCRTDTGSNPRNPVLPVIGTDLTAFVTDLADAAVCLRINGGSCGTNTTPTTPITSEDEQTTTDNSTDISTDNGSNNGSNNTANLTTFGPAQNIAGSNTGANGDAEQLAHTGATTGLLAILLAGLLLLLTSGGLLRRRRS